MGKNEGHILTGRLKVAPMPPKTFPPASFSRDFLAPQQSRRPFAGKALRGVDGRDVIQHFADGNGVWIAASFRFEE
jgi:hypothetical protein